MNLTTNQKRLLERVINVFETGTTEGKYDAIIIFHDGPHNIRQITYGRSQTTEFGNLHELVQMYADTGGAFSNELRPFVPLVGNSPLTDNAAFKTLLRQAGREDPVMQQTQDEFFEKRYFKPAVDWADEHEFTLALSALVIYDSYIHSGSILRIIRNMFPEVPPNQGGDERAWVKAYVNARHNWLSNHPRAVVRGTVYRTKTFKREIDKGNWDLSIVPIKANGVNVNP